MIKRFVLFGLAGGIGFVVDALCLFVLTHYVGFNPFIGRVFSIACAMIMTWIINRTLTFGPSHYTLVKEGSRYVAVGLFTSGINFVIYVTILIVFPLLSPLIALGFASAAAMLLSYQGYSKLVFYRP